MTAAFTGSHLSHDLLSPGETWGGWLEEMQSRTSRIQEDREDGQGPVWVICKGQRSGPGWGHPRKGHGFLGSSMRIQD